jgi:hypothetical protein
MADINNGTIQNWIKLSSEYIMGGHMLLSGTLTCRGIQSPICVGDNLEIDNTVFHIESVTHTCTIDAGGRKTFHSSLSLSNGISANPTGVGYDLYSGIYAEDFRSYEPGMTHESIYQGGADDGTAYDGAGTNAKTGVSSKKPVKSYLPSDHAIPVTENEDVADTTSPAGKGINPKES